MPDIHFQIRRVACTILLLATLGFARQSGAVPTAAVPAALPSSPPKNFCLLPIFENIGSMKAGGFTEDDLQTEMTNLKTEIGQNHGRYKVGFAHIFQNPQSLQAHCRLAQKNNLSVGVIIAVQTHSGGVPGLVLRDFRQMQWRQDGVTWEGEKVIGKNGNPEFPSRDWRLPTPSRYCPAVHAAALAAVRQRAVWIHEAMTAYPGVIVAVNASIEEELATGGEKNDGLLADYSPYAVTEYRDWLRHTGMYDDTSGQYAGQGAPAEIVGPFIKIKGILRSPFYDDPSPTGAAGTGTTFNDRFGTHFTTWALRSWDLDKFSAPITDPAFSPSPISGIGFTDGGFDAPRRRDPTDAFWKSWSWDVYDQGGQYPPGNPAHPAFGFRQVEIAHFVTDVLDEARRAGIPAGMLYAHQIPSEQVSPTRNRSGASPIWTGLYAPSGTLGITRFGPVDTARLTQYSHDWGIFEWHPKPFSKPDDPALYEAARKALDTYSAAGGHIFFAGWWHAGGEIDKIFPLNDSRCADAYRDWLNARNQPVNNGLSR